MLQYTINDLLVSHRSVAVCLPSPSFTVDCDRCIGSVVSPLKRRGLASCRGYNKKRIISMFLYLVSIVRFNHSLWEAPMFPHE